MYVLKNAWKNIRTNKMRNVLTSIIILVIGTCSVIALSINSAAKDIVQSEKDSFETEVTFSLNRENVRQNLSDKASSSGDLTSITSAYESLTEEEIENYASSDYVKDYYIVKSVSLNGSDIESVSDDSFISKLNQNYGSSLDEGTSAQSRNSFS